MVPFQLCNDILLPAGKVHVPRVRARRRGGADAAVRRLRRLLPHVLPAAAAGRRAEGRLAVPSLLGCSGNLLLTNNNKNSSKIIIIL